MATEEELDKTFIRLRAVRRANIQLYLTGLVHGLLFGFLIAFLIWGF